MPQPFAFRPATSRDFDFCWPIYRDAMQPLTAGWQEAAERRLVTDAMGDAGTSIVRAPGAEGAEGDAGWLQVGETRYVIHLAHLYLVPAMRNRGLGTAFLRWMCDRAERKRKELTLDVMASNPARALYERLKFRAFETAGPRIKMRWM